VGQSTPAAGCRPRLAIRAPRFVLGAVLVFAALMGGASSAVAAPLTAHLGATGTPGPIFQSNGIDSRQAGCAVKGLGGFGITSPPNGQPSGLRGPGLAPSPAPYFYVVVPIGQSTSFPFACPPISVVVSPPVGPEPANNSALLQWVPTPGATAYQVHRTQFPNSPFSAERLIDPNFGTNIPAVFALAWNRVTSNRLPFVPLYIQV